MLDKVSLRLLNERLHDFYSQRETTLENIESCKKDLEKESDPIYNRIYMSHKKVLNITNETIDNLEYLKNNFDFFKNQKLVFATSNESKLNEIKRIVLGVESLPFAKDIEEVDGIIDEVILHKAKDARIQNLIPVGTSIIVEDTIIRNLDTGKDITDIKWNVDSLEEGTNVEWITSLALNDGINIYVFRGKQQGVVTRERGDEGFAFDPYFIPVELYQDYNKNYTRDNINYGKLYPNNTLAELNNVGLKDMFSARSKALNYLAEFRVNYVFNLTTIKDWEGRYQNEKPFNVFFNSSFFEVQLNLKEDESKEFKCFNDFKNLMIELDVDFDYDRFKQLAKDNNEIYVCLNPYDVDINGSKTLIMSNTDGGLDHIYNQCEMEI